MPTADLDGLFPRVQHSSPAAARRRRRARWRRLRRTVTLLLLVAAVVLGGRALWNALHPMLLPAGCEVTQARGGPFGYPTEKFANASTIAAIAMKRELPARAAVIATATALQESKLRNLEHGDLDSVGLFQQRPSQGWGTKAQILDPVYAAEAFYDHLVKVRGWQSLPLTRVAQAVQRSGYPEAYARHEAEAVALAAAFTGERPAAAACRLEEPSTTWSRQRIRDQLGRETGLHARTTAAGLEIRGADAQAAWLAGSWAVAHAQDHGTRAVTVGDRTWTRTMEERGLRWEPAAAPLEATTVRLDLTTPRD